MSEIILVVGLGNPGYEGTRHNLGADFLQFLIHGEQNVVQMKSNIYSLLKENMKMVLFLCPDMMNISGKKVVKLYKMLKCKVLVVCVDDMEVELGKWKISYGKGSNGHNGIKDIVKELGGNIDIYRVRIGIGRPKIGSVNDFVLAKFNEEEIDIINVMMKELKKIWFELAVRFK